METALDVLSRAASMVETNDKKAQDSLYKGLPPPPPPPPTTLERPRLQTASPDELEHKHMDPRSSPGKELPSKMSKHERIKVWLEVSKPPKYEKEPPLHSRTTHVSSQMSVRSSSPSESSDRYRNGEPVTPSDTYSLHHPSFLSSHPNLRTPPPHPPPCYPHPTVDLHSPSDGPLNLSISNSGERGSHSPSQSRPSVITCATLPDRRYEVSSNGSASPSRKDLDICDPAIEEHFRRSLGKHYPEYLVKPHSSTPSPPPPPPPVHALPLLAPVLPPPPPPMARTASPDSVASSTASNLLHKNVNVTGVFISPGSVDDHFARALGDSTWSALKAKNDPAEVNSPGSVDDHFAKALGDTWLKLKAEKEPSRLPAVPPHPYPMTHAVPHPLTHPVPRSHSLPHPLSQRPSSSSPPSHSGSLVST